MAISEPPHDETFFKLQWLLWAGMVVAPMTFATTVPVFDLHEPLPANVPAGTTTSMVASDGSLYLTNEGNSPQLSILKVSPKGKLQTFPFSLKTRCAQDLSPLVEGPDGNLYGTSQCTGETFQGQVFKMTPSGIFTTLVQFNGPNGEHPKGPLVLASDGTLYGVTQRGGTHDAGTLFELSLDGEFTTRFNFDLSNGHYPFSGLAQTSNGDFYGTTLEGGATGQGTIFRWNATGLITLASFGATTTIPLYQSSLTEGTDGSFYGITEYGGYSSNVYGGSVFRLTPSGQLTTVYSFDGQNAGGMPISPLVKGRDGLIYGTTSCGNGCDQHNGGVAFQITASGILRSIGVFDDGYNGKLAKALSKGPDGTLWGLVSVPAGTSSQTEVFKVTDTLVAAPARINAIVQPGAVNLSWKAIAGAQGYYIYQGNNPTPVSTVTSPSATITQLPQGVQQVFAVASFDDQGTGAKSHRLFVVP